MYEFLDRRYALALYEMCKEAGNIETVLEELGEVVEEMDNNEGLIKIIRNPQINKHNKKRIFEELFKGKIEDELLSFLLLLIDKGNKLGRKLAISGVLPQTPSLVQPFPPTVCSH